MADRVARKLNFTRKLLLSVAGWLTVAALALFGLVDAAQSRAQTPTDNKLPSIADTWQGTLHAGKDLRTVVKISKADDGGYKAVFYSIDQGGDGLPVSKITLDGTTVKMSLTMIGGTYEGKLSPDGKTITGTWTQGPPAASCFDARHARDGMDHPSTAGPKIPPMAANANPSFEVATIKPNQQARQGCGLPEEVIS